MRKSRAVRIVLIVCLVLAATTTVVVAAVRQYSAVTQRAWEREQAAMAETAHETVYEQYAQMTNNAADIALTVTENGEPVGQYTLAQLGVLEDTRALVDQCFHETDRMLPQQFAALSLAEKTQWVAQAPAQAPQVEIPLEHLQLDAIFADLAKVERVAAVDAEIIFTDGVYQIQPETAGNELDREAIVQALQTALAGLTVSAAGMQGETFELTGCDCYLTPEVTTENIHADYQALLAADVSDVEITVDFQGLTETLTAEQLASLLTVDAGGQLRVAEYDLRQLVNGWSEAYRRSYVPYIFDSYVDGPVAIDFLPVDYVLDREALVQSLRQQLRTMASGTVEAPYVCMRNGQPFGLGEEYVEVDVKNQVMTYFKDGEAFVTTDIVTGAAWRSPTPEGLYKVENKDTACWLIGADYCVYVDYWVGFISFWYGLHDADWRTEFGADNYLLNGSHGCVNTPKEAMAVIYDNIDLGVPVLVYES